MEEPKLLRGDGLKILEVVGYNTESGKGTSGGLEEDEGSY